LHETDIDQLIFAPGFTTSDVVTDTSGRGVGMDVVRQNIEKLGGRVGVANEPGQGVVMTMILPLTLAVLDVMLVRSGGTPYVVPLASVIESMQAQGAATSDLPSGSRVLRVRQNYVRLFDLAAMFGASRVPNGDAPDGFIVLCETDGGRRAAIVVDEILGQQQVVIKSIEANFARVEGIAGGTILGDGSVALILDVAGLELMAERRSLTRMAA
jgi:two-component system chemotaxis sensor kinase CheA